MATLSVRQLNILTKFCLILVRTFKVMLDIGLRVMLSPRGAVGRRDSWGIEESTQESCSFISSKMFSLLQQCGGFTVTLLGCSTLLLRMCDFFFFKQTHVDRGIKICNHVTL